MDSTEFQLACGNCKQPLRGAVSGPAANVRCGFCFKTTELRLFPAYFEGPKHGRAGETLIDAEESSCYYHPEKRAEVPCDRCGRFLCALCDIEVAGEHLCPACFSDESSTRKTVAPSELTHHDSVALALAVVPAIFVYITIFTAPIAIYMALRHWNTPKSILPRSRWRSVLALLLAGLQIVGWITILGVMLTWETSV